MRLRWTATALDDRNAIFDYIAGDNPRAAVAVSNRIKSAVELLRDTPEIGRKGRVSGTWELVIAGTPYIAAYEIMGGTVRVLTVLHGAQEWPTEIDRGTR